MTQKKCPRCKEKVGEIRKCYDCGTDFCWKCVDALGGVVPIPDGEMREVSLYCPECRSTNITK